MPSLYRIVGALALVAAAGAGIALYVIRPTPVHVEARPPADLSRLSLEPSAGYAPSVAFTDAYGRRESLSAFRGRYVLLNLWATWCAPCVEELPELSRMKAQLPQIDVLAVNVGRATVAETAAFLKEHSAGSLGVHVDANAALIEALAAQGLPLTVLIDPNGREIARALGPCSWGTPAAVTYLRKLIEPAKNAAAG